MICSKRVRTLILLPLLSLPSHLFAAQSPYQIDVNELDQGKPAASAKPEAGHTGKAKKEATKKETTKKEKRHHRPTAERRHKEGAAHGEEETASGYLRYTVKPGDHIFKILVGRLGMSNEAAEKLVPEVVRINHIDNIRKLEVGQTLLIPKSPREPMARPAHRGKGRPQSAQEEAKPAQAAQEPAPAAPTPAPAAVAPPPVEARVTAPPEPPSAAAPVPAPPKAPAATLSAGGKAEPNAAGEALRKKEALPGAAAICSVTDRDPARMVDAVLSSLSVKWSQNRIIESDAGAPNAFSIRVDRYFEFNGGRCIVSIGESDPYSYTLIRLLQNAGYRTAMIGRGDSLASVTEKLSGLVGQKARPVALPVAGGGEVEGLLVQRVDASGEPVVLTGAGVDGTPGRLLPEGCASR